MEVEIQLLSSTNGIDCAPRTACVVTVQVSVDKTGTNTLFSIFYQD